MLRDIYVSKSTMLICDIIRQLDDIAGLLENTLRFSFHNFINIDCG